MKFNLAISIAILVFVGFFLLVAVFGNSIGYMITAASGIALAGAVLFFCLSFKEIKIFLSKYVNKYSITFLLIIILFFLIFSVFFLPKTELIYYDENIYQGVALNILHSGNAMMCEYGTAYVQKCFSTELGFDPGGWPFLIAVSFKIFGISNSTTYNLELFLAVLSIICVFLISSIITGKKSIAVISTAVFAMIPELYIWSKTLANPDLPFMAFLTLATLLFIIFLKTRKKSTLLLFVFILAFTVYLRVQALLLVPLFIVVFLTLGDSTIRDTFKVRLKEMLGALSSDWKFCLIAMVFLVLIAPQLYTMLATTAELQANAAFYLYPNTPIFSASYILQYLQPNIAFLSGLIKNYPIIFLPNITIFAILGVILLLFQKKYKNRFAILILLLGIAVGYFIFFLLYFSGSVLVGVSVRYFLVLYPPLSILAAFGICWLGDFISEHLTKAPKKKGIESRVVYVIYAVLFFALFAAPFVYIAPSLIHPTFNYYGFPLNTTTANITGLNPYTTQYTANSANFIENNYKVVPNKCLVLSEVPSIWFMLNRSSSYIPETDVFTNPAFSNYSCYYLDLGFWCTVSPYNTTVCKYFTTNYNLKLVATGASGRSTNFSIYQVLNYSPR